jgi:hypothetical protein
VSEQNPIRVFVTHTFGPHPDYFRVFEYLESAPNFFYVNCSSVEAIPGAGGKEAVKDALREQIKPCEVVVVLGGMYLEHRDWLTYQMDAAQAFDKPLVAMEPFGGIEDLAPAIAERADEVVGWNDRLIVDALRRQARHEDTQRWEVIDFEMP